MSCEIIAGNHRQYIKFKPQSAQYTNSKSENMKNNPNRQELIDFINENTPELENKVNKIEDLSNGVHYLHLLHKVYPDTIKLSKVNAKAFHQHENIVNLKYLATYLSQVKAPFSFEVTHLSYVKIPKVSQRNYQENLNLLKNLHKLFYLSGKDKRSVSVDSNVSRKTEYAPKRPEQKLIIKPPAQITKPDNFNKARPTNDGLKNILKESKCHTQQVQRILVVLTDSGQNAKQQAAEEKLKKISKILGIDYPESSGRKPKQDKDQNYSNICSGSKSSSKKQQLQNVTRHKSEEDKITKTEGKDQMKRKGNNPECQTDSKKVEKQFDCEQIKQSMLKRYELRPSSYRKNLGAGRLSANSIQTWVKEEQQEDTRYNQNLLSPEPEINEQNNSFRRSSRRKSIIRNSQGSGSLSLEKNKKETQNKRKVHFSAEKICVIKQQASSDEPSAKKNNQILKEISADKNIMHKGIVNTGLKSTSITKNSSLTQQLPSSNNSSTRLKISAAKDRQQVSMNSGNKGFDQKLILEMLQRSEDSQVKLYIHDNSLNNLFLILIPDLVYEFLIKWVFLKIHKS